MGRRKLKSKQSNRKNELLGSKTSRVPRKIVQTIDELRRRFRQKFGRDPGPNDPLFFDPDSDAPAPLRPAALNEIWERLADTLLNEGQISAAAAYAMKKTGLLVTEQTKHSMSQAQREEWKTAIDEFVRSGAEVKSSR